MTLTNRSERSTTDEEHGTPVEEGEPPRRRFGRRDLRRGLLIGTAVAVGVVAYRRRRRRSKREFTEIELDTDPDDR